MTYFPNNPNGQAVMASSVPVVIASNQSAVPVTLASTTITGSVAVTGGLTDTQLRATPVPISGTVATGGITDTQIRATALPVSIASDADNTSTGTLAAAAQTVVLTMGGKSAGSASITGTWVGTITFEGSVDGTTWNSINAVAASTSSPQPTTTVNGLYRLSPAGLFQIRVNMTAFTSGSASVSMRGSAGTGGVFVNQILPSKITDGTNTATIKGASTGAVAGDSPLVVALHPTSPTPNFLAAQAVTGTFFQATQPVSATALPLPTGASTETTLSALNTKVTAVNTGAVTISTALPAGSAIVGKVGIDQTTPGTTNLVALTAETTKVIGTVNLPVITKGTQGTTGVTTQDIKDGGRNQIHFYTVIPVLSTATDSLQSLTGTKSGATVTATTTPAVVTTGKTLRITRLAATYVATATSGYGVVRLRYNTAGVVAITSPIAATIAVGSGGPTTVNSIGVEEATLNEAWEFAAATGIGISVQGFAAATATAVGYMFVSVTGYEY